MTTKVILKTIKDINLQNKRVLVRVDYNVSLGQSELADHWRLTQSLATLNYLLSQNCLVILLSHLGRPEGRVNPQFSLKSVVPGLEKLLNRPVIFIDDYLSASGREKIKNLKLGEVVLLENLRFHPGEQANDLRFAQQLASLGEVFVQDGFGVSHRPHASVVGISRFLPAVAGLLLTKEAELINKVISQPKRPLVVILGGAKTKTKIGLINRILEIADDLLLGGCLANTFLKAAGFSVGQSKIDDQAVEKAKQILGKARQLGKIYHLPSDVVLGDLTTGFVDGMVLVGEIAPQLQILDIGPQTRQLFAAIIAQAGTIIWNGPLGMIENNKYRAGTEAVYRAIIKNKTAVVLIGGGDTLIAITKEKPSNNVYLSTGGGAMLEFIEKGTLPGIKVLEENEVLAKR